VFLENAAASTASGGGERQRYASSTAIFFASRSSSTILKFRTCPACSGCYISDLIPTSAHLDLTWVMGYDLDPVRSITERKRFYARAIPERWMVLFTHDHHHPFGQIEIGEKGKPILRHAA
jgi:hypothetical protein